MDVPNDPNVPVKCPIIIIIIIKNRDIFFIHPTNKKRELYLSMVH